MSLFETPAEYLHNLQALTEAEAKKLWKQKIKEKWNYLCAYCGSSEEITLDHVISQFHGGQNISSNIVAACRKCNHDKGTEHWKYWYVCQDFYDEERFEKIEDWLQPAENPNAFSKRQYPKHKFTQSWHW